MTPKNINETLRKIEPFVKDLDRHSVEALSQALLKVRKAEIKPAIEAIIAEIQNVLQKVDEREVERLTEAILRANTIIVCGAGRMGMALSGFGMRLGHLGLKAYTLGDTTLPSIGQGDLLVAGSRSGETQTIFDVVQIAKKNQATVALVTGHPESRMGKMAEIVVHIKAPSRVSTVEGFASIQPMTTLNEQCMGLFLDALVLVLMQKTGETHETMWSRHSNLE